MATDLISGCVVCPGGYNPPGVIFLLEKCDDMSYIYDLLSFISVELEEAENEAAAFG
jgi:hypothetical protein